MKVRILLFFELVVAIYLFFSTPLLVCLEFNILSNPIQGFSDKLPEWNMTPEIFL